MKQYPPSKRVLATSIVLLCIAFIGCTGQRGEPNSDEAPTPWPTLAPVITPEDVSVLPAAQTGPQLSEKFRVGLVEGVTAVYPLAGQVDVPVRVELLVLDGDPDPIVKINNAVGDQLAYVNMGTNGQPEVVGQFVFPEDGFYELGIESLAGTGQVGVSIYQLDPARVEADGQFDSTGQQLTGRMEHPSSFHIYNLPLQRGQRVDISAVAVTEGLDLLFDLYDPDGFLVAARDDNEGVNPVLWGYMPSKTGDFTLVLTNFSEATGDYQVSMNSSESLGDAALGTRAEIEVSGEPRRSVWLTVPGRAHDAISIEARPLDAQMDMALAVYDPNGNQIVSTNATGIDGEEVLTLVQFGFDGPHQLEFTPLGASGRVEYLVRAIREADLDVGGRVALGQQTNEGDITGRGTAMSYSFNAASGQLIGIDAQATIDTGLDLAFDLYSPNGDLITTRDNVIGSNPLIDRVELLQSGTYVLVLRNVGANVGPFELVMSSRDAPSSAPGAAGENIQE